MRTIQSIAHGASNHVCVITLRLSATAGGVLKRNRGIPKSRQSLAKMLA